MREYPDRSGRRRLRDRLGDVWRRVRRRPRVPDLPPDDLPPDGPALVPAGPPRRPRPGGAVALEPPEPPQDLDLYGKPFGGGQPAP